MQIVLAFFSIFNNIFFIIFYGRHPQQKATVLSFLSQIPALFPHFFAILYIIRPDFQQNVFPRLSHACRYLPDCFKSPWHHYAGLIFDSFIFDVLFVWKTFVLQSLLQCLKNSVEWISHLHSPCFPAETNARLVFYLGIARSSLS